MLTGTGERRDGTDVLIRAGRIHAIGTELESDATVIDADGRWLTPGLIDVHSHNGVYPAPRLNSTRDGNELTAPITAEVWAEHGVWPQDAGFGHALAGGVNTCLEVNRGTALFIHNADFNGIFFQP